MGTMKICRQCNEEKDLHSCFYVHSAMADGYLNKCKECVKIRVKKHRAENDSVRLYDKLRYWTNPQRREFAIKQRQSWYLENKERANQATKNWIEKNPEKRQAHIMVNNAIRDGRLTKQPCCICGDTKVHAHHHDYAKPLDVTWVCPIHHAQMHMGMIKEIQ